MKAKIITTPKGIADEYKTGAEFKSSIGQHGIFEQTKRNERFYVGDQWYGCKAGNERPLVRRNIIKRIGEYKMSVISAPPISVNYSAEGVPDTAEIKEQRMNMRQALIDGNVPQSMPDDIEITTIATAMSDYFRTTAERLKFDNKKEQILRNAYISGTGILFTYWDDTVETGLYADNGKQMPIKGDISCDVLNIENVNFGDPNNPDVQKQPYIIIAQRRSVEDVKREAHRNQMPTEDIVPDRGEIKYFNSGDRGENEPKDSLRVTVYTKLYKEWDKNNESFKVMAVRVTEKAYVRKPWCLKIRNYPIAKFEWERRYCSAYGESEITYLIPNQIAINRSLTAAVWGLISTGMPIMVVNGDTVSDSITNDPGQIIKVFGTNEDVAGAIRFVQPPNSTTQFQNVVNDLSQNTMSDAGANDTALGNLRPDNASAIIQMREAATAPMQVYMNRFYDFIEDVARIWADFWLNMYGNRRLKVSDRNGTQYLTFKADRYKSFLFTARIDVGSATVYSEAVTISTLDSLLTAGIITPQQYLDRMPSGIIPDKTGLLEDMKQQTPVQDELSDEELLAVLKQQYPEQFAKLSQLPPEAQAQLLNEFKNEISGQREVPQNVGITETEEVGDL